MKRYQLLILLFAGLVTVLTYSQATMTSTSSNSINQRARRQVVVELFTSEGCSSCPPADEVLAELAKSQPVANTEIIVLSEHIDYWDRLGWKDPFSAKQFTDRQYQYARSFRTESVYTPQMVINGRYELNGSNRGQALELIGSNKNETLEVKVNANVAAAQLQVHLEISPLPSAKTDTAEIMLAIAEDNLQSQVVRGENSGRKLHHTGVVRSLTLLGPVEKVLDSKHEATINIPMMKEWQRANLRVVAFVQNRQDRRIIGAGSTRIAD